MQLKVRFDSMEAKARALLDNVSLPPNTISRAANPPPCDTTPIVVKPKDARRMLACGQTRLYELLASGDLQSFNDGRSRKILVASIHRYIAKHLSAA
jgi:hypothetical protein